MPAFMPKPSTKSAATGSASCVEKYPASAANVVPPSAAYTVANAATRNMKPMCIITR